MLNIKARDFAVETKTSIEVDENLLNIFNTVDYSHLKGFKPSVELPDFDGVSKIFVDIETYSSNRLIFEKIIEKLYYGLSLTDKDKIAIKFALSKFDDKEVIEYYESLFALESYDCLEQLNIINIEKLVDNIVKEFGFDKEFTYDLVDSIVNSRINLKYTNNLIDFINQNIDEWDLLDEVIPKAALYADYNQIGLIGLINEQGKHHIIDCEAVGEKTGLMVLNEVLKREKPLMIGQFNGFFFDLPVIIAKCRKYKIECPFKYTGREICFRSAQMFGKPQKYQKIIFAHNYETAVFDLFHHTLAWDFVMRKLTAFSLKKAPIQLGLRKSERLELSYSEMKSAYTSGDLSELKKYLYYDLEDTLLMGNFLLPEVYYQKLILPDWHLQSIATGGAGSKWDSILKNIYKIFAKSDLAKNNIVPFKSDHKKTIKGGLTGGRPGLYKCVAKWDFNSMYPHIMLLFGINSIKDIDNKQLEVLAFLLEWRLRLKKEASDENTPKQERILAKQIQAALKVLINSAYGSLATQGLIFNDYTCAALVTAYGRALLKFGVQKCIEFGGTPISWDTDGLYYSAESPEKLREIYERTQAALPEGFTINFEVQHAQAMFIPLANCKKKTKSTEELEIEFENIFEYEQAKAMKKTYIIAYNEQKIFANGGFRKRDKSRLECEFVPNLVKEFAAGNNPHDYYEKVRSEIEQAVYPIEKLAYHVTIKSSEKRKVQLGLGKPGDSVVIYKGEPETVYGKKGQALKNKLDVWVNDPDKIDYSQYLVLLENMYEDFCNTCNFNK